jgi:hypothetical protein
MRDTRGFTARGVTFCMVEISLADVLEQAKSWCFLRGNRREGAVSTYVSMVQSHDETSLHFLAVDHLGGVVDDDV